MAGVVCKSSGITALKFNVLVDAPSGRTIPVILVPAVARA